MQFSQLLPFDIHANWCGDVGGVPRIPAWTYSNGPPFLGQLLSFDILAYSLALFCTHQKLNPFVFMRFHTLRQKSAQRGIPPAIRRRDQNDPS
jgi:hypothetical protein